MLVWVDDQVLELLESVLDAPASLLLCSDVRLSPQLLVNLLLVWSQVTSILEFLLQKEEEEEEEEEGEEEEEMAQIIQVHVPVKRETLHLKYHVDQETLF